MLLIVFPIWIPVFFALFGLNALMNGPGRKKTGMTAGVGRGQVGARHAVPSCLISLKLHMYTSKSLFSVGFVGTACRAPTSSRVRIYTRTPTPAHRTSVRSD